MILQFLVRYTHPTGEVKLIIIRWAISVLIRDIILKLISNLVLKRRVHILR